MKPKHVKKLLFSEIKTASQACDNEANKPGFYLWKQILILYN